MRTNGTPPPRHLSFSSFLTETSTISGSTLANCCRSGAGKAGSTPTIRVVGSNGIAATTWAGGCRRKTVARSSAGRLSGVTSVRSRSTVSPAIPYAVHVKGRRCCTGRMTVGKYDPEQAACWSAAARRRHLPPILSSSLGQVDRFVSSPIFSGVLLSPISAVPASSRRRGARR